ncbi:ABC-three component system middle component 1 [Dokdonia ponticola]|uniref:ABC-three component system middle component 1 n=1 Tax=Dokdonia ponticola TaxID=2041041 RepID=A0ABV9HX38_9FLAO
MNFFRSEIRSELKEIYDTSLSLYVNSDTWKIKVLFFLSDTETLNSKWEKVSSAISVVYQSNDEEFSDFEKWNLYIIYVCTETVTKELRSKIENNKFSSRKIIEDNFTEQITDEVANDFIVKHITHDDLIETVINTTENIDDEYEPINAKFWKLIPKDDSLNRKTELQDEILLQFEMIENEN